MSEPEHLRISDAERHAVAERLREAAGDGRIDLTELDERLEATYAARTYADLVPITVDLPSTSTPVPTAPKAPAVPTPSAVARPQRHLAMMGGFERTGVWTVPPAMTVTCVIGGATLDLREARWAGRECVITVRALMGGATIVVGPEVDVVLEGVGIMGGYSGPGRSVPPELRDDSPVLRVRGVAFWAGVAVERRRRDDDAPDGRAPHRLH